MEFIAHKDKDDRKNGQSHKWLDRARGRDNIANVILQDGEVWTSQMTLIKKMKFI